MIAVSAKSRYVLLAICIAVIAVCGYKMYKLPLWEWWSFPFSCAVWAVVVLLFLKRYNLRYLLLSTLSGVLFVIGFPPHSFPLALFFAFVPLLIIEREIRVRRAALVKKIPAQNTAVEIREPKSETNLMRYAYNAFVIYNIGTTWWVTNAESGLIGGMIANYLNAFFMATAFWLFHKFSRLLDNLQNTKESRLNLIYSVLYPLSFVSIWIGFEYLHLNWDISWTWLTLGNAFAERLFMVQWYEYTGVLGGTLWILIANYLIFKLYPTSIRSWTLDFGRWIKINPKLLAAVLAVLILPIFFSGLIIGFTNDIKTALKDSTEVKEISVVAVQPNFEPVYEKFKYSEEMQLLKFLRLAYQKVDSTTDYLVFPETSFNFHNVDTWNDKTTVQSLKKFVQTYPRLHLVTGIEAIKTYAEQVLQKPAHLTAQSIRTYKNPDGTFTFWEAYNAATQISNDAPMLPIYKKGKFVPGPEILPFPKIFGFLQPVFESMGGSTNGLGTQPERSVFDNRQAHVKIGPVICYESIYGDFCTDYVRKGANALFVVTNDGWWGDTPGYQQHLFFSRLRAIELRRPVVRSANTGASCFIDVKGNVTHQTKYGIDAVIKTNLPIASGLTFYAQYGDYIGKFFSGLAVVFLLLLFISLIVPLKKIGNKI